MFYINGFLLPLLLCLLSIVSYGFSNVCRYVVSKIKTVLFNLFLLLLPIIGLFLVIVLSVALYLEAKTKRFFK